MSKTKNSTTKKTTKTVSTKQKLTSINTRLKRGDVTKVATKGNYSISHVYRVLANERTSAPVVNLAYTILVTNAPAKTSKRK